MYIEYKIKTKRGPRTVRKAVFSLCAETGSPFIYEFRQPFGRSKVIDKRKLASDIKIKIDPAYFKD